jgi:4,5-dihydroxyphthalate decarboxylase
MKKIALTLAVGDYDHTRDLANGRVAVTGIDLTVLNFDVEEIFFRFHESQEWEVSELSMGMYTSAISRGDDRFIAIPVFPSRAFRHSAIYVHADGPVRTVEDLADKRIGIPQWSQTATIYMRGYLSESVGIPLSSISWVQAGVNEPGREEPSVLNLPPDIKLQNVAGRCLNEMLLSRDIDAIISARPPQQFGDGDQRIIRLFSDYRGVEEQYFRETAIFPIMHTIAIKREVYQANRWIARNLVVAFEESKRRCLNRLRDITASHVPLPWAPELLERIEGTLFKGQPYWPYGVDANRTTLDSFLRFTHEQGTCHRRLQIEDLFAKEAMQEIRV